MRNGSSGNDERGWQPARHPYSGRGPQPQREGVPFGPEVSWPNGFRQVDYDGAPGSFDSGEYRQLVESSYGQDGYPRDYPGDYGHADPRSARTSGYQQPPAYQSPAMDDYGDPGYADPSYDGDGGYYAGPSAPPAPGLGSAGLGSAPGPGARYHSAPPAYEPSAYEPAPPQHNGYQPALPGSSMAPDPIYPVTGAQEIYRDPDDTDYSGAYASAPGYPESRRPDPRLDGLRYDELRYDDADSDDDRGYDPSRYDEPLDDEAWFAELRRGGPAFGPNPGASGSAGNPGAAGNLGAVGDPVARGNSSGPAGPGNGGGNGSAGNGRFQSAPVYDRSPGYPPAPGSGNGPRMSVVPGKAPSGPIGPSRGPVAVQPGLAYQAAPAFGQAQAFSQGPGLARQLQIGPAPLAALPPGPVGVLTPPAASRFDASAKVDAPQARPFTAPAPAGPSPLSGPMRTMPGPDAMVGPDTVAWDITAEVDELDVIEEYWDEEDEGDGGYAALLHDLETDPEPRDYLRDSGPMPAVRADGPRKMDPRKIGRRRGGSNDHRLWLGLGGVVVVAAVAIFGIIKLEFPPAGPSHELITPASVASYQWAPALEQKSGLPALREEFSRQLGIPISQVVSREYESGAAPGASTPEIVMYLGGHLPNQSPADSLRNFEQKYKDAVQVNAGPMGGDAVCVETALGTTNSVAQCAWFDDDSVGVVDSPTMTTSQLASVMLRFRPVVELVKK